MANKKNKPLVILAAGGTGGHVFPAEALAVELISRGFYLVLITDRRGDDLNGKLAELDTYRIWAGGIAGKKIILRIKSAMKILIGTFQAWFLIRRLEPVVVVGFGGYPSVPTMLAAAYSGRKVVIHEQNAVLGRANQLLAKRTERIATSFATVAGIPKALKSNTVVTGMPVRPTVVFLRDQPYPKIEPDGEINLIIFGGSQGANIFSSVVPNALKQINEPLRRRIKVTQQCRPEDVEQTRLVYQSFGINANISSFFNDMPDRIACAHLVICRAGASTIAELTTIGRPAILVPYRHAVDDHQSQNAYAVDEMGGGWLIPEHNFTDNILADRLESLLSVPEILKNAGEAAKAGGVPNAASRLADLIIDIMPSNFTTDYGKSL
jgi:UDP-N-acetylglucosamine--N-acetylmuramyl-(pentapeptide) pyrophosphoryl-undecaprenol N-acetylglucosamine transferase